jgi:two-component sensor histidine kinase
MVTDLAGPRPVERPIRPPLIQRAGLSWKQIALWVALPLLGVLLLGVDELLHIFAHNHEPQVLLITATGGTGAIVILLLMAYSGLQHLRSQALLRQHLAAVEHLTAVAASISAQIGEGVEVLTQLAEAGRRLLGMGSAAVLVLEPGREAVRLASAVGHDRLSVGDRFELSEAPAMRACIVGNRMLVMGDAEKDHSDIDLARVRAFGVRSFIFAPLSAEGRVIGVLAIADPVPRCFAPEDIRLAELWASQAAVILQNRAMYQRMQQALADQRELESQREALANLSLDIYAGDSLEASLQAVADRAPALLHVDSLTIAQILNSQTMEWELTAITDDPATRAMRGMRFISGENSPATEALRRQQPVEVPDATAEPRIQQRMVQAMQAKSLLFIPLNARDGSAIALMTLVLRRQGAFTAAQRQIAQYLVTRFGAAIEIARLRERAVADAQAKAILLRELHHRVKNNLAGIAGLLSINQPQLPPDAQQWLERVTERIRAMAHAHELFSGEGNNLTLRQLFRAMLSSLATARVERLRVETTVEGADVALCPERAVALVMVLHELCHNAMVHGLGEGGLLRVDAHMLPLRQLLITVTDDGSAPKDPIPHLSSGMGLGLVQGLVKRELHGQFNMAPVPGGGTRAMIQFRLLDCEQLDGSPTCRCVATAASAAAP